MNRRGFRIIFWNRMRMNVEHLGMQNIFVSQGTFGQTYIRQEWKKFQKSWLTFYIPGTGSKTIYDQRSVELCLALDKT